MSKAIVPAVEGESRSLRRYGRHKEELESFETQPSGFLCFKMDDDEYGIDLNLVRQIVKPSALTWVPRTEPFILGVVSIRGEVATLIDLRSCLRLLPTKWPRSSRILIVERDGEALGLLVDEVTQVRRLPSSSIERDPSLLDGPRAEYVLALGRTGHRDFVVIIDLDAVLREWLP
ncbi:MAG: chemotaxis protein CheW [Myxococcota bacterium]|jgi:purine-binding chemotaxis protein CheW|nr:chemotaxis protein CheW [Myxococcota bacterium]